MVENIYTVPVIDAVFNSHACCFCYMYETLEKSVVESLMASSYMDTSVRNETDKMGFCRAHLSYMLEHKNALGLALMLHSHLNMLIHKSHGDIFPNHNVSRNTIIHENCYICNIISKNLSKYFETFSCLFEEYSEFRDKVALSCGFCVEHFSSLLPVFKKSISAKNRKLMVQNVINIQTESLRKNFEELDWFIKKFDYRFKDEPWNGTEDINERTIKKISKGFER